MQVKVTTSIYHDTRREIKEKAISNITVETKSKKYPVKLRVTFERKQKY